MIHPKLLEQLPDFFPSTCKIEKAASAYDAYQDEVITWSTRHAALSCAIAPTASGRGGREIKRPDMTYVIATHHVTLAGYYNDIIEKDRAIIGALTLDILLVEHDSHHKTTRLACEVVR